MQPGCCNHIPQQPSTIELDALAIVFPKKSSFSCLELHSFCSCAKELTGLFGATYGPFWESVGDMCFTNGAAGALIMAFGFFQGAAGALALGDVGFDMGVPITGLHVTSGICTWKVILLEDGLMLLIEMPVSLMIPPL